MNTYDEPVWRQPRLPRLRIYLWVRDPDTGQWHWYRGGMEGPVYDDLAEVIWMWRAIRTGVENRCLISADAMRYW